MHKNQSHRLTSAGWWIRHISWTRKLQPGPEKCAEATTKWLCKDHWGPFRRPLRLFDNLQLQLLDALNHVSYANLVNLKISTLIHLIYLNFWLSSWMKMALVVPRRFAHRLCRIQWIFIRNAPPPVDGGRLELIRPLRNKLGKPVVADRVCAEAHRTGRWWRTVQPIFVWRRSWRMLSGSTACHQLLAVGCTN